jgi:uncharacterized protein (TIGR02996 family)
MKEELLAAVRADPEDVRARLVYADWLQAHGDPRGELIALQAQGLTKEAEQFVNVHAAELLGDDVAPYADLLTLEWHLGFIRSARVRNTYERFSGNGGTDRPEVPIPMVLEKLLDSEAGALLETLIVGIVQFEMNSYDETMAVIGRKPRMLTRIELGDFAPEETELNWSEIGDCDRMWPGVRAELRSLRLSSGSMRLGTIDLPELRELEIWTGGLETNSVVSIANAKWPKIERLDIMFGQSEHGASGGVEELMPLLQGKGVPRLRHLGLRNFEFGWQLARALPAAHVLRQLHSLDLSFGNLCDEDARELATSVEAFGHLSWIDVRDNYLGDAGQAAMATLCREVRSLRDQRKDRGPGRRYAAIYE